MFGDCSVVGLEGLIILDLKDFVADPEVSGPHTPNSPLFTEMEAPGSADLSCTLFAFMVEVNFVPGSCPFSA